MRERLLDRQGDDDLYEMVRQVRRDLAETNRSLARISSTLTAIGWAFLLFLAAYFDVASRLLQPLGLSTR